MICKICGKDLKRACTHFVWKHNLSFIEYIIKFEKINILQLYKDGFSAKQIAEKITNETDFSTQKSEILKYFNSQGIKRRNTSEAIKEWSRLRSGPWNKGLTKWDHPSILAYAESRRGENNPFFKIKDKNKWLKNVRNAFQNKNKIDYVSSSLEMIIGKVLIKLGIQFITQFNIENYFYDFLLPQEKIIIEVNGTYWHSDPRVYSENYYNERSEKTAREIWFNDEKKKHVAVNNGYGMIYIWEQEIKSKTIEELMLYVVEIIQNTESRKNSN